MGITSTNTCGTRAALSNTRRTDTSIATVQASYASASEDSEQNTELRIYVIVRAPPGGEPLDRYHWS
ncbi:hypothetical protein GWI33_018929 [Rhynchophorus ferrugineus]|uniref:Uncharacterized protein n=1 Tax=Rhynchophorus ferrugineus TaxID=354439 RepID=A0A834I6D0_RHYFE|nr:hypothetical protein GWI33_018929 [Rhynchophorus ferrugineus]